MSLLLHFGGKDRADLVPCKPTHRNSRTKSQKITRYHSNRGVSAVSRCAADLEIAERL